MDPADLDANRAALARLDEEILERIAERQRRSLEIGRIKHALGRGTRDFVREKVVVDGARARAEALGLDPNLAQDLVELLIQASLSVQEQDRITTAEAGAGRTAALVGGAGQMGRWFVSLLSAQGWDPVIVDPAGPVPGLPHAPSLEALSLGRDDLVLLTTPPHATAAILDALRPQPLDAVVVEIASIKQPVAQALRQYVHAGGRAASLHPMFGPDTSLLSGRHVLVCDLGDGEATELARSLFAPTLADLVDVSLEDHDRMVAWVLNASHAVNLVFGHALSHADVTHQRLAGLGSTTFDAQTAVTARVLREDPDLYRVIQSDNPWSGCVLNALRDALDALRDASGDPALFRAYMARGRGYLDGAPPASGHS